MKREKGLVIRLLSLFVCLLLLSSAAMLRNGRLFGAELRKSQKENKVELIAEDSISVLPDGGIVVNTKQMAKDVAGYGGPVPLRIYIDKDGIVSRIEAMPNAETPDFFEQASSLFAKWQGKTIDEALAEKVDAVSGATFSSNAIIENMKRGLALAKSDTSKEINTLSESKTGMSLTGFAALAVALLGAIVPLFTNNRHWHYVQLTLNVVVIGLWTGTFVSYALLLRLFSEGVGVGEIISIAAPLVVVAVALFYPLFGKSGHYCAHICPFGSAQELAGKLTRRKPRLSPRLLKILNTLRMVLWGVLMLLMLTGITTAWVDYELFTAFLFSSASIWTIVVSVVFLVISVWVPRPYCRFVCPTGVLIKN